MKKPSTITATNRVVVVIVDCAEIFPRHPPRPTRRTAAREEEEEEQEGRRGEEVVKEEEEDEEEDEEEGKCLEEARGGGADALPSFRPAPEAVRLRTGGAGAFPPPTTQPGDIMCTCQVIACVYMQQQLLIIHSRDYDTAC